MYRQRALQYINEGKSYEKYIGEFPDVGPSTLKDAKDAWNEVAKIKI